MFSISRFRALISLSIVGCALASGRALEPDRHYPESTEQVVILNVRQFLSSKLVTKRIGLELIRQALKAQVEVSDVLDGLGLNLLKDVDTITIAGPESGEGAGLLIVKGRFDVEKFRAQLRASEKEHPNTIKSKLIQAKNGRKHLIYELTLEALESPLLVGIADQTTILGATSQQYLLDGLSVKAGQKAKIANKKLLPILAKLTEKHTLGIATIGNPLTISFEGAGIELSKETNQILNSIKTITGGIFIDDDVQIQLSLTTADAKSALTLRKNVEVGIGAVRTLVGALVKSEAKWQPLADLVGSFKVNALGRVVSIRGSLSGDGLKKLIP